MKTVYFLFMTALAWATPKDTIPFFSKGYSVNLIYPAFEDCDSCGCSASGGSMGFGSLLNSNYVGIRYLYQFYRTNDGLYSDSPWYDEQYTTLQAWGRLPLGKKIQLSVLVPFHFHQRQVISGTQTLRGLGDVTLLANYRVFQNLKKDSTTVEHILFAGGGVKIPTGIYDQANNGSVNPGYQLGTGSWDATLMLDYTVRHRQIGLNTQLNYTEKSANSKAYRFGNQVNFGSTLFYIWTNERLTFAPQFGVNGEVYAHNYQHGQKVPNTAGNILFSRIGFEISYQKWSLGCTLMVPLHQNLMDGNVEARYRLGINLNYTL